MANKTVPTSNGVNLVVDPNGKVLEAFTKQNNVKTNLPSTDSKVTTAISNINTSPALKTALNLSKATIGVSPNYSPTGTSATTQAESANTGTNTSNKNNDAFYGPIIKNTKSILNYWFDI